MTLGILDDIKKEAAGIRTKIQTTEEQELEAKLNCMFYLEKNIEKELAFLKSVMTRGQETAERKGLHASSIIATDDKFCYRQSVLSLMYRQKQGEQINPSSRRIFAEGDAIHEKWQRLFIRAGYANPEDCDKTVLDHSHGFDMSYTPDILCEIDGIRYVVEIKSVNTIQFRKMVAENKPHLSGKKQLFLYMYLTGIHDGFVLCEDKNTQEFRVSLYKYDWDFIKPYVLRLPKIRDAFWRLRDNKKLICRHEKCTEYGCKMAVVCPMREVCYRKEEGKLL